MTDFEKMISKKNVEELMEYINDFERYSPWALTAVVNELKTKGKEFSDEELNSLYERIEKKKEIEDEQSPLFGYFKWWKKYIVIDPKAPLLYSKFEIFLFSLFFSAISGAVLLAVNIKSITNKIKVIGVGVLFTIIVILLGDFSSSIIFNILTILAILAINAISGWLLSTQFWNEYIGRETEYRAKSAWTPLVIVIIIAVLLLFGLFS